MAILESRKKKNNDNFCVIGAGRFGQAVINKLNNLNKSVILVDNDAEALRMMANSVTTAYNADASDIEALRAIGIQEIETVIVGTGDNIEIVATLIELGVKNIIARSVSKQHSRILKHLGVTVSIRPEEEAGEKAASIATNNNHIMYTDMLTQIGNGFYVGKIAIDNPKFIDVPLKKINFNKWGVSIVVIKRKNYSFLPNGTSLLQKNDVVTFIGEIDDITNIFNMVNTQIDKEIKYNEEMRKEFIQEK
ncbi:potassium channel family protein [Candidatus Mycoplasma pogonae]